MKMDNKRKPAVAFYFTVAGIILTAAGILLYTTVIRTATAPYFLLAAALVIGILGLGIALKTGSELSEWAPVAAAVLVALGLGKSASMMVDPIGWAISGLYQFSDIASYVYFLIVGGIAVTLFVIAGFMKMTKAV